MGEKKEENRIKTELNLENSEIAEMNSSSSLIFPGEKKCARASKRGVYSLEEHALQPQTQILDFHTFIEEKCAQERLLTRCTHSLLFIDCPEIVYDYIISAGC